MLDLSQEMGADLAAPALIGLTFELPESTRHIIVLRKTVRYWLGIVGVSQHDTDDLETIFGELATNAVRHAKGGNYRVAIEVCADQATVIVTDNGVGFKAESVAEPGTVRPDELADEDAFRIGGFGLVLVRSLCEEVDIYRKEPRGTIVRLTKTLHHAG